MTRRRTGTSTSVSAVLALLVLTLLVSCSGRETPTAARRQESEQTFAIIGTDPRIVVHNLSEAPQMLVGGTLFYLSEGRCLAVKVNMPDGSSSVTAMPIWPSGVQPLSRDGKRGVEVPNFGSIMEGDSVTASGSLWNADDKGAPDLDLLPEVCKPQGGFIVFNVGSFT